MSDAYREQHKKRLSYMPWLYRTLNVKTRSWAGRWQNDIQQALGFLEGIELGEDCFIAPQANIFAEAGHTITLGDGCQIAADCFLHGPLVLGNNVCVHHGVFIDGGTQGITIGNNTEIAAGCRLLAVDDSGDQSVSQEQTAQAIRIGDNVRIGANSSLTQGITVGDKVVIRIGSVVTQDVPDGATVAGNPAQIIRA